jgi:hypothetical protein
MLPTSGRQRVKTGASVSAAPKKKFG